jgi:hypothetical protein
MSGAAPMRCATLFMVMRKVGLITLATSMNACERAWDRLQ